jgi:hypothetical protein
MKLWGCGFIILSIAALVLSGDGGGEEYMHIIIIVVGSYY